MGRTSDLLNKKRGGGAAASRPASGGSRTRKMLESRGTVPALSATAPANQASKQALQILRATGRVTAGGKTYTMEPTNRNTAFERSGQDRDSFDAGVRERFARRNPEVTGGEWGEIARGLNSGDVRLTAGKSELEALLEQYNSDPTEERAAVYDSRYRQFQSDLEEYDGFVARYNQYNSADGIKERMDALRAQRDTAQKEYDFLSVLEGEGLDAGSVGASGSYGSARQARDAFQKYEQDYNDLLNQYYHVENQERQASLRGDEAMRGQYDDAQALQADMDKVTAMMAYTANGSGDPAKAEEYKQYLMERYGLDQKAIDQYAISGAGGAYVPRTDGGYNNLYELYQELQEKQEQAVSALGEGGYDYGRMAEYEQTLRDAEEYAARQAEWQQYAQEHPILSSIDSVLVSPFQGVDYLKTMAGGVGHSDVDDPDSYEPMNVYDMDAANFVSTVRGTVSQGIEEHTDWELFGQNVASFLYQTGMSMADSAVQVAAFGSAATLFMGASAASNQAKNIIERGGTNAQAFWGGLAAGAAETFFEKFSIDHLLKPRTVDGWKVLLKETAKQAGVEASEEVFTEIANILSDTAIMGENSDFSQSVRDYQAQGMGEEEAKRRAYLDLVGQVGWAGAGGFLSGAGMGSAVNAANYAGNTVQNYQVGQGFNAMGDDVVQATIQEGLLSDPSTKSYQLAQQLQQKLDSGGTITNLELGRLYQANVQAIDAESGSGDLLLRAAEELTERGRVTNSTASDILGNPSAVNTLSQEAGLALTEDMSKSRRRSAIKSAVETLASREGGFSVNAGETAPGQADAAQAAMQDGHHQTFPQPAQTQAQQVHNIQNVNRAAAALGENGAKALSAVYDGSGGAYSFYAGFAAYYGAGVSGQDMGKVRSEYGGQLNEAQRFAAYSAGRNDAAASLAREKRAAQFAPVAGQDSGLVYDDFVREAVESGRTGERGKVYLDSSTADKINAVSKALGVRVRFVDSVRDGTANAAITGSDILVEKDNPNPVAFLLGHEWTHRMQELAPEQYRAFREAAGSEVGYLVEEKLDSYAKRDVFLSYEAALDEAVADYAGRMVEDGQVLDDFIQKHREDRTLLEKIRDAIRALVNKLTGAERRMAQTAEGKLTAALEAAAKQAKRNATAQKNTAQEGGEAKFSLKTVAGKQVVWIENSTLTNKELNSHKAIADFIAQHIGEVYTIIESGQRVYIGDGLPSEYTQSKYTSYLRKTDRAAARAKNKALDGLGELIETATNRRWEQTKHGHSKDARYGMYRYDSTFAFPARGNDGAVERVRAYDVELLIRNASDGKKYLYDIVNIKENTTAQIDLAQREARSAAARAATGGDASRDSVTQDGGDVNTKFSLKEYTDQERKDHANAALDHFGQTHSWKETGYLTQAGKKIDFSGRNDGAPGGYRTVDHRDISDALGEDYGGDDYSGAMVQFIAEGNIRISPESGGINLSVAPTKVQAQALDDFISRERGEVILDLDTPGGDTVSSTEYPRGTRASKVLADIARYFESGEHPRVSELAQYRYSLKGTEQSRELAAMLEENDLLRERVGYWKGQTRRTQRVTTDKKAVLQAARELIRSYGADLNVDDIDRELQSLYDYIASGRDGDSELTYAEARRRAETIAQRLVESAVAVDDEEYRQYSDLRSYLRTTRLTLSEKDSHNIPDYGEFRKRLMGRLNLGKGRTNIDQAYQELSSMWPEFFDERRESRPADQLLHIAEVLDGIYDITEYNPFSRYMDQAVTGAANEIMEAFFDLPQTRKTFADRQAAKLDQAKAKGRQQVQKAREQTGARLEELRQKNCQRVQDAIARERSRRDTQIERLKDQYQARDVAGRERRSAAELRRKITRHAQTLSQKLLHPSDKQHIPEALRTSVAAMLEAINQESQYTIDPETGKRTKGGDGLPVKRTEAFRALKEQYEAIANGRTEFSGVLDPDLVYNLAEVLAMKDTPLYAMGTAQLATVWQTVKAVEKSIFDANKLLGKSRYAGVEELSRDIQRGAATKRRKSDWRGVTGWGDRLLNLDMLNPLTFFHLFGEGGDALYHELQAARDQKTRILAETVRQVQEAIGKTDIAALQKRTHTFQAAGGELTLTTAQLMSLYELSKREQAQDHIYKGGLRATAQETGVSRDKMARENLAAAMGKIDAQAEGVRVTQENVAAMLSALSKKEMDLADKLQAIMQGYLAQEGNRESMRVYGYQKFTERDYFPISSDPHQVQTKIGDLLEGDVKRPRSIAEWGSAKGTVNGANNGLLLGDIFDVFAQHAVDMATYASSLGVMEDLNRVRNFTFRDSEGTRTGNMAGIIQRVAGQGGDAYLNKLLQDVSAGTAKGGAAGLAKLTANYKAASVGANIRVALQQPTSYLRAGAVLDPKYLADPRVLKKGGWEKALQHAPIAAWKDWGNFEINQGRQIQNIMFGTDSKLERARNLSMSLAGKMDSLTWGCIWNACELETANARPGLANGSAAFYEAVAARFADVIDQTQVVDNVLGRSQIMRSGDNLSKMATSFMGEPTQSYNLVYRAVRDCSQEQDGAKRNAARKKLGRAVIALTASQFVNAIAQALWDAVRDDDERDRKYWERVLGHILPNFADNANPLGMVPYMRDVLSVLQGYDVARMDMEAITGFISACQNMSKAINGEGRYTLAGASANLLAEAARIFGLPVATVKRDLTAIARSVGVETGDWYFQYQLERGLNSVGYSGNRGEFYDIAFGALKDGELDVYRRITGELMEQGVKGSTIESAMRERAEEAGEDEPGFTLDQDALDLLGIRDQYAAEEDDERKGFSADGLSPSARQGYAAQRAEDYREWADTLTGYSSFRSLDGKSKDKALDSVEALAEDLALRDHSGGQFTDGDLAQWERWAIGGADYGVEETEAILFKVARDMTQADKDKDGDSIPGSWKENALEAAAGMMPWLTDRELEYLISNYWAPEDETLKEMKANKFMP